MPLYSWIAIILIAVADVAMLWDAKRRDKN